MPHPWSDLTPAQHRQIREAHSGAWQRRYSEPMTLTRDVTRAECPWLYRDFLAGETLWTYPGNTYGSVDTSHQIAMCERRGANPFWAIPRDALGRTGNGQEG